MNNACLVTFCKVDNFGAMLQCYGLQKALEQFCTQVDVLDFNDESIRSTYKLLWGFSSKNIFRSLTVLANLPKRYLRSKAFSEFRKEYLKIKEVNKDSKLKYDCMVLGSDQIWNFDITKKYRNYYLGDIPGITATRYISYAASIGKSQLSDKEKAELKEGVERLNGLSVREEQAKVILNELTTVPVSVHVDPVFLIDKAEWYRIANTSKKKIDGKYILIYALKCDDMVLEKAEALAKLTGLPVFQISNKDVSVIHPPKNVVFNNVGPKEFLNFILNAEFVVTSSFHATAMSIVFEKNFYTVADPITGNRAKSLLEKLNLLSRYSEERTNSISLDTIDYIKVNPLLLKEKEKAINYLRTACQ